LNIQASESVLLTEYGEVLSIADTARLIGDQIEVRLHQAGERLRSNEVDPIALLVDIQRPYALMDEEKSFRFEISSGALEVRFIHS
jgi:hypothetical protein